LAGAALSCQELGEDRGGQRAQRPEELSAEHRAVLQAPTLEAREQALIAYLCQQVGRVLRLSEARIDPAQPLDQLGMDSLMAIELKTLIEANLGVLLPAARLLQSPTLTSLAVELNADLAPPQSAALHELGSPEQLLHNMDQLSDDQVDILLNSLLGEA
jgi:acyl carrier protein